MYQVHLITTNGEMQYLFEEIYKEKEQTRKPALFPNSRSSLSMALCLPQRDGTRIRTLNRRGSSLPRLISGVSPTIYPSSIGVSFPIRTAMGKPLRGYHSKIPLEHLYLTTNHIPLSTPLFAPYPHFYPLADTFTILRGKSLYMGLIRTHRGSFAKKNASPCPLFGKNLGKGVTPAPNPTPNRPPPPRDGVR